MVAKKATKGLQTKVESITVRINPKMKYGLELLSRKQHRTISAVVEWAIDNALRDPKSGFINESAYYDRVSGKESNFLLDVLWHVNEVERFIQLVFREELGLLTYEEEILWETIKDNAIYWLVTDRGETLSWNIKSSDNLNLPAIKNDWTKLLEVSKGQVMRQELRHTHWAEQKSGGEYTTTNPKHIDVPF